MAKAGDVDYSFAKVSVETKINGTVVEPIEVILNYPLNGVPTCALKLAVGSNGMGESAKGHQALQDAKNHQSDVEIIGNFTGEEKPGQGFKQGTAKIFEGKTMGPRIDAIAHQAVGLSMIAEHFVADLAAANKISWITHPDSGFDVSASLSTKDSNFHPPGTIMLPFSEPPIVKDAASDVWKNGIEPLFTALASRGDAVGPRLLRSINQPNSRVLQLLGRINSGKGAMSAAISKGLESGGAKEKFNRNITHSIISKDTGQTFWDTLLNFGSIWMLGVVPLFDRVLVVPLIEVYNKAPIKIGLDEYWSCVTQLSTPRSPLRGVALFSEPGDNNFNEASYSKRGQAVLSGLADVTQFGGEPYGHMLCMQLGALYSSFKAKSTVKSLPASGATPRWIGNPGQSPQESVAKEVEEAFEGRVLDHVARGLLCKNLFRDQTVGIGGRLRFDISPGAQVEVEIPGNKGEPVSVFGCVTQVSYIINSERPYVSTNLTVSYLRTKADQNDPMVPGEHPLYGANFVGTDMI